MKKTAGLLAVCALSISACSQEHPASPFETGSSIEVPYQPPETVPLNKSLIDPSTVPTDESASSLISRFFVDIELLDQDADFVMGGIMSLYSYCSAHYANFDHIDNRTIGLLTIGLLIRGDGATLEIFDIEDHSLFLKDLNEVIERIDEKNMGERLCTAHLRRMLEKGREDGTYLEASGSQGYLFLM